MNKKFNLAIAVGALFVLSVISSFFIDVKLVMINFFSILLLLALLVYKKKVGQELILALLFSIALTSYYVYEYKTLNIFFGKINLFPLVAWAFGLVLLREIYEKVQFEQKAKFIFVSLLYIVGLFIIEFFGFYILNIRLVTNYPSLFGIGIIHAPIGMKVFYLLAGPIYLLVTDYLKVE